MRPDRDTEWRDRVRSLSSERVRSAVPDLKAIQRAALSATQVTGDEHWDLLVSIVKGRLESLQSQIEVAFDHLRNSDEFTTSEVINQKLAVRLLGREISTLEWVIELPRSLKEQGDRAKELLGTVDESSH